MSTASDARFWDKASRRYSRSRISDMDAYERTLDRTRAILGADDRVLELGCGTGTTALRLADGVRSYLATDISSEMISIAKEKHAAEPVQTLVFRTATAESLGPDEAGFNAAPGFNYLHLVRDVPETLRRIHSVLAPGGVFVSKTPCLGDMNLLIRRVLLPALRATGRVPHVTIFRAADVTKLMTAAGFDIVTTELHGSKRTDTRPSIVALKAERGL